LNSFMISGLSSSSKPSSAKMSPFESSISHSHVCSKAPDSYWICFRRVVHWILSWWSAWRKFWSCQGSVSEMCDINATSTAGINSTLVSYLTCRHSSGNDSECH
jgi:hypothetical protein